MKYMEKRDRSQISFLPECVEDTISDENPVRVIDAFVDSLDMEGLGFQKAKPAQTGRPAYDPRDLLKLYLYGYLNRIRSSRMLMRECRRNIELFYLLGGLKPDFRTIADFRKDNAQAIRNCFRVFGTVKWYRGAHYLLCKGKEKAAAELGLSFLAYNMTRAIHLVGAKALIEAM